MRRLSLVPVISIALITLVGDPVWSVDSSAQDAFFERIRSLCGARFTGRASFPEDPGEAFRDKDLVAIIDKCGEREIRIPFHVGDDRSRTWVLARIPNGIEFWHDHRNEDGTADEITRYGGTARAPGSEFAQSFPADEHTTKLIPEAATNEWFVTLAPNGSELTYYLERHGKPRFRATLKRVN